MIKPDLSGWGSSAGDRRWAQGPVLIHPSFDFPDADLTIRVSLSSCSWHEESLTDFKVHKSVLAEASTVFADMLEVCDLANKANKESRIIGEHAQLEMKCKFASTWPALLGMCYSRYDLCTSIDPEMGVNTHSQAEDFQEEYSLHFGFLREHWEMSYRYQFRLSQLLSDISMQLALATATRMSIHWSTSGGYGSALSGTELAQIYVTAKAIASSPVETAAWRELVAYKGDIQMHEGLLRLLDIEDQNRLVSNSPFLCWLCGAKADCHKKVQQWFRQILSRGWHGLPRPDQPIASAVGKEYKRPEERWYSRQFLLLGLGASLVPALAILAFVSLSKLGWSSNSP